MPGKLAPPQTKDAPSPGRPEHGISERGEAALRRQISVNRVEVDVKRQTSLNIGEGVKVVTLGERIDEMGFGPYQLQVFILSSGFIVAEGAEVAMAAGLVNVMAAEFDVVSTLGRAMLMTFTFIGFAVGTFVSGPVGDAFGRRLPMLVGYIGVITAAGITCLSVHVIAVYICRFLLGVFAGIGIPTACIAVSEVSPTKGRGMITAALGIAYILGELWAALGLCILMPDLEHGSWRWLLGWAVLPAVCLLLFGLWTPVSRYDTPFFLGSQGRNLDLVRALNLMATSNGKPELVLADDEVVECERPIALSMTEAAYALWKGHHLVPWVVMAVLSFAKDFAFYGTDVLWPQLWVRVPGTEALDPAEELLLTASLGVPGACLAMYLMSVLPRRTAVASCASICAVAVLCLMALASGGAVGYLGVGLFKLCFPTWQMVTMLLPSELFGTQIRAWAFASSAFFGRIATILSPVVVELGQRAFILALAFMGFVAASAVLLLPETKDCELSNVGSEGLDAGAKGGAMYGATTYAAKSI